MEGISENTDFLQAIRHPIETIHSGETSLEEIFIQVTGEKKNE
jgi:fluoroquinolone transport system ATP-binding protein